MGNPTKVLHAWIPSTLRGVGASEGRVFIDLLWRTCNLMSSEVFQSWEAKPGDILLLSGDSKGRPYNLGYQSVVRLKRARYTHVALVLSPYRIIHATLGKGVEIRAWSEIRHQYDPQASSVARLESIEDGHLERLSERAKYYYGQRYSVFALPMPSEAFENQQGIVCSQFVAQVFHDIGIHCTGNGARKCVPADIDSYTGASSEWLRIPFKDYRYDPHEGGDDYLLRQSRDLSFACDGYAASAVKDHYSVSYAVSLIESAYESMMTAVKSGLIAPDAVRGSFKLSGDSLAPANWITVWKHHFAAPKSTPAFMFEDGVVRAQMKHSFIESCGSIGSAAQLASDEMGNLRRLLEDCVAISTENDLDRQASELYEEFAYVYAQAQPKVAFLDEVLGSGEGSSDSPDLDVRAIYASGVFESEADISAAAQCLLEIAKWAGARNSWHSMRASIHAALAAISFTEAPAPSS